MKRVLKVLVCMLALLSVNCWFGLALAQDEDKPLLQMELVHSHSQYPAGASYPLALQVTIAPGYHINSDKPNSPELIPTTLSLKGVAGISLGKIMTPAPQQHMVKGEDEPWLVWDNKVTFIADLQVDKDVVPGSYEMVFNLMYQACDDNMCQMPTTEQLMFLIEVVAAGQPLIPINDDVFTQ